VDGVASAVFRNPWLQAHVYI